MQMRPETMIARGMSWPGILELAHVADGGLEGIGGPGGDEQPAHEQEELRPCPKFLGRPGRCWSPAGEGCEVLGPDIALEERDHADDEERQQRADGEQRLRISAVRRMPRCWMAKTTSMIAAPRQEDRIDAQRRARSR